MKITRIDAYIFSPTGTTRQVTEAVAGGIQANEFRVHDGTRADLRETLPLTSEADLVILAAPVYYGRVPESVVPVFNRLTGGGKPVVLIAVYGNREYDDALLEMYDISIARGFIPAAAGAFIGEHSYSMPGRQMAENRPDTKDLAKATAFGIQIRERLETITAPGEIGHLELPGNRPYLVPENLHMLREIRKTVSFTPETDMQRCTQCGICAEACPEQAIDSCDVTDIDRWKCIVCFACVKSCPEQAKDLKEAGFNAAIQQMAQMISAPKFPEVFIAGS